VCKCHGTELTGEAYSKATAQTTYLLDCTGKLKGYVEPSQRYAACLRNGSNQNPTSPKIVINNEMNQH